MFEKLWQWFGLLISSAALAYVLSRIIHILAGTAALGEEGRIDLYSGFVVLLFVGILFDALQIMHRIAKWK